MQSLLKMLPAMLRLSGDNDEVREQAVFAAWRAATGSQLSNACVPFRLYRRTLIIATKDQTWKHQMEQESKGFIFKLNSLLGAPLVTYIEFRVDPTSVAALQKKNESPPEFHHLAELEHELEPAAEKIRDEKLREVFLRAAAKSLERKGE